jgi:hypothetical protein
LQCYALFVAVLAPEQPERMGELMAYQSIIAKASQKYRWPSWVIYDQSFQQEVAGTIGQSWARVDPSTYALCFTGQAMTTDNWCSLCQTLDHTLQTCPAKASRKRAWNTKGGASPQQQREVCLKYNRFGGDCKLSLPPHLHQLNPVNNVNGVSG